MFIRITRKQNLIYRAMYTYYSMIVNVPVNEFSIDLNFSVLQRLRFFFSEFAAAAYTYDVANHPEKHQRIRRMLTAR